MSTPQNDGDRPQDKRYWLDEPRNVRKVFWLLCAICALLAIADFFYHKHAHFKVEEFPVFYGLYGFVCFVFIVFAGKLLRKIVMRDEDYYDR
ncbi:MAG TPA: hypothetical protein VKN76_10400 [Kiloniellaceae bacterium]|nr:hypothetical protein [Kiloniellaceae bacterium]